MSQRPNLAKIQSRRRTAEPKVNSLSKPYPNADLPKAPVEANRVLEKGTPSFIIKQIGADSQLNQEITLLEAENFNSDAYMAIKCQTMSEANIRRLCKELADYKQMSAEQMKRTVFENYKSFIRSSKEISELEGELRSIHSLLTAQANVLRSLTERPRLTTVGSKAGSTGDLRAQAAEDDAAEVMRKDQGLMAIPEQMIVRLAERNFPEALRLLEQGEGELLVLRTRMRTGAVALLGAPSAEDLDQLEVQLQERRADLLQLLADVTTQPAVTRLELRQSVAAIAALGDAKRAHTLLLDSHASRMHAAVGVLRPIGISYSVQYTSQISRMIFSAILQAVVDSGAVFGDALDFTSELVLWAHKETEWCSTLLQRYVLSSAAAAGGLRLAAECVQIAVGHCSLLEERGLALAPVLLRLVRPSVEQALEANIRRIEDSVGAMVAADNWLLQPVSTSAKGTRGGTSSSTITPVGSASSGGTIRLTSSALRLYNMVQDFLEDVVPIVNMQLTTPTLDGLQHLFKQYILMLNKARAPPDDSDSWTDTTALNAELLAASRRVGPDGEEDMSPTDNPLSHVSRAITERQQLALIANATVLSEELPRLAVKLTNPSSAGQPNARFSKEARRSGGGESKRQQMQAWKKALTEEVDSFRMGFCLQRAMKLLFPDTEQESALLPNLYFYLDQVVSDMGPGSPLGGDGMPTQTLQDFLRAVLSVSESATDVLVGRDRLVLSLLTQFGLALLTLVCHDRAWEDEQCFVGPVGLQKFILDITFLKEVAARYHFSSRRLQQEADNSIERARMIFDPEGTCPGDSVFQETARLAITQVLTSEQGEGGQ